jgi:glutamate synthase domain-containing protein 2
MMPSMGSYWIEIDKDRCQSWKEPWKCGACMDACEHGVFDRDLEGRIQVVNEIACVGCRICAEIACPNNCIRVRSTVPEEMTRGIWTTSVVEVIHQKADTGTYALRGLGTMRALPHFDGMVVLPSQLASGPPRDKYREDFDMGVVIGEGKCERPITLRVPFVIAAISYGAISKEGKMAFARAAARLGTLANTGEGGMFPGEVAFAHGHEQGDNGEDPGSPGGFLAVQWSTGRWGVSMDYLKRSDAIEIKVGQGAKPGMGGHLLGSKVTANIATVRGIPVGSDALSPCRHYDIEREGDLAKHVEILRDVTDYQKPIMIKLGPSRPYDDVRIAAEAGVDAISIDGMAGGTGASPEVVTQHAGVPTIACIRKAAMALDDLGLAGKTKLIAMGGIRDGADAYKAIALGADAVGMGAALQIAMGCRACMSCHQGGCRYGLATQKEEYRSCMRYEEAAERIYRFVSACAEELKIMAMLSGHGGLGSLSIDDLRTIDLDTAALAGIKIAGLERPYPGWDTPP